MQGAIFDLDGTLLDSNGVWKQVDDVFLARHHLTKDAEYTRAVTQMEYSASAAFVAEKYHLNMSPQEIMAEWEALSLEAYAQQIPMKEGAREVLTALAEAQVPLALVTLSPAVLYEAALKRHGVLDLFQLKMTVPKAHEQGKDRFLYDAVCRELAIPAAACIGFDDDLSALEAMRASGMTAYALQDMRNGDMKDLYSAAGFPQYSWADIQAIILSDKIY